MVLSAEWKHDRCQTAKLLARVVVTADRRRLYKNVSGARAPVSNSCGRAGMFSFGIRIGPEPFIGWETWTFRLKRIPPPSGVGKAFDLNSLILASLISETNK